MLRARANRALRSQTIYRTTFRERSWQNCGSGNLTRSDPPGRGSVRSSADLHDVLADSAPNLSFMMITRRIRPGDLPRLSGRVPHPQRRPVYVHLLVGQRGSVTDRRHDPDVLHCATFERPAEVDVSLQAAFGHVNAPIDPGVEFPAAHQINRIGQPIREFRPSDREMRARCSECRRVPPLDA
jgi:hypothetical protein